MQGTHCRTHLMKMFEQKIKMLLNYFSFSLQKKKTLIAICMTAFCASTKNMLQSNAKTISKQCHYDADELKPQLKRLFWIWKENSKCCHLFHGIK